MIRLTALDVTGAPDAWRDAGFALDAGGAFAVDGVTVRVTPGGAGVTGWVLDGVEGDALAGIPLVAPGDAPAAAAHPNGTIGFDHVVLMTSDLDATTGALAAAGVEERRRRDAGRGVQQVFYRIGPILEVVGPVPGPTRLWGVAFTVADLDAAVAILGERAGRVKDAVQPGRRIVTVHDDRLGCALALMSQ